MRFQIVAGAFCTCLLFVTYTAHSQTSRPPGPSKIVGTDYVPPVSFEDNQQRMAQEMARRANLERQERMRADTEKLFKLAEELKTSVGKTDANVLSIEVLKKAEEIEKLAHSVKQKMKGPN